VPQGVFNRPAVRQAETETPAPRLLRRGQAFPPANITLMLRQQSRRLDLSSIPIACTYHRLQNARLKQVKPDPADEATLRLEAQQTEDGILTDPRNGRPERLATASGTEVHDVNLHSSTGTPAAIDWPLELFLIKILKNKLLPVLL
jgi:hypothetical protein